MKELLRVLDDISLHVDDGEFVSIVGPNGAGKSTLLKIIVGGTTMYSGVTQYDSVDISKTPRHKIIDDGVGYVGLMSIYISRLLVGSIDHN